MPWSPWSCVDQVLNASAADRWASANVAKLLGHGSQAARNASPELPAPYDRLVLEQGYDPEARMIDLIGEVVEPATS